MQKVLNFLNYSLHNHMRHVLSSVTCTILTVLWKPHKNRIRERTGCLPSLMAVNGVPSSSCSLITLRATSFPFTLKETKEQTKVILQNYMSVVSPIEPLTISLPCSSALRMSVTHGFQQGWESSSTVTIHTVNTLAIRLRLNLIFLWFSLSLPGQLEFNKTTWQWFSV